MINDIFQAVELVRKQLEDRSGIRVVDKNFINGNKHCVVKTKNTTYYVLFKRGTFKTFGKNFPNMSGAGESINHEYLTKAINNEIDYFLVVYSNGKTYYIRPEHWMGLAKRNNTIRKTDSGELTYSVSIEELRPWTNGGGKNATLLRFSE